MSHQLPIWTLRRHVERKRLWHDPRKRQCGLASLTSFHFDGAKVVGHRLQRAGRAPGRHVRDRPDGQGGLMSARRSDRRSARRASPRSALAGCTSAKAQEKTCTTTTDGDHRVRAGPALRRHRSRR